jgi:NADPH-dependent 2,4-dienoyl-CoA reductase/sulfur reductase-like enzyme/ferredoxin
MRALEGEVITSALFANGIKIFGHHERDRSPQGIYCVNGQCSQCVVLVNGVAVKGCMTVVEKGMRIESCEGNPSLPPVEGVPVFTEIPVIETEVLVIGGGPAGITAAIELGRLGVKILLVDDKTELGGKLTLQTHTFFGTRDDCYAGTRGIDIARILTEELSKLDSVDVMLSTTATGVFYDKRVGLDNEGRYLLVEPKAVLVACGAREKNLVFAGCDLPGVYGAGAFQTLLNRDWIRPTDRLFIVGGGNVGLITGYHAIQAGIQVIGLVEALPKCGGYKVHEDKLRRLGVPVMTSHTVIRAEGGEHLERITIARIDKDFRPVEGTAKIYKVDTLLVAVGLSPVDELYEKLVEFGIPSFTAGDSEEIAEASAAIFSGKITGRKIARERGLQVEIPDEWEGLAEVLRKKPGAIIPLEQEKQELKIYPIIRCVEEIPCNPCVDACPVGSILIPDDPIMGFPIFKGDCTACGRCVAICPGLAINMIKPDYNTERKTSLLTFPFELEIGELASGSKVVTVDMEGNRIGEGTIVRFRKSPIPDQRKLVSIEVPKTEAFDVAGFYLLEPEEGIPGEWEGEPIPDETIVCRCERISAGEVRAEIRAGVRDMNILKATIRTGMGACGGKTCTDLILRLYREEGIDLCDVTKPTIRPFVAEVPLKAFAGTDGDDE